jgi:hypothetical protein
MQQKIARNSRFPAERSSREVNWQKIPQRQPYESNAKSIEGKMD